jgi:23S rRNA (cytidine2498-2'-O)-methyltransferase
MTEAGASIHGFLPAEDSEQELRLGLLGAFPGIQPGSEHQVITAEFPLQPGSALAHWPFVRQFLPQLRVLQGSSIRIWTDQLAEAVMGIVPDDQPWVLHVAAHYGAAHRPHIGARAWHSMTRSGQVKNAPGGLKEKTVDSDAGRNRCRLIREALCERLGKQRRHLRRNLQATPEPFTPATSLVQLLLLEPEHGVISVALAPLPYQQRHILSPFPKGEIVPSQDKNAPSRAFAKLIEAEMRLGRQIGRGESCVDLGAAPGSWTYVAVQRGARVIAVDRAPLRADLAARVECQQADAFAYAPPQTVDWLLCDVIAAPERSGDLLFRWLTEKRCRHFIVTLKSGDDTPSGFFSEISRKLAPLCSELRITKLCTNKKEVCAFGTARM